MPSQYVPVGGVAQDGPASGDPLSRATTPVAGQTHDIVIGGVGFTLYRANTDESPSKTFSSESSDLSYTPTFVPRQNQDGQYSDDQQDFFMAATQRDWSAGEGLKYWRRGQVENGYWAGEGVLPTVVPGQVRAVPAIQSKDYSSFIGSAGGAQVTLYVKGTGQVAAPNDLEDTVVRFGITQGTSTLMFQFSMDGGYIFGTQQVTGAPTNMKDVVDACVGDDGYLYVLEGSRTTTQHMVHRIKGPSATTVAWDNWTVSNNQCNTIAVFKTAVYVGDSAGRLLRETSGGGGFTVIKDFAGTAVGAGVITQLLSTPEGLYIFYLSPAGTYKVFLYTGTEPTEVINLPRGWRQSYTIESGIWKNGQTSGIFGMSTQAMAWSEGVLYISGLCPARDHQQSRRGEALYHSALYYYSAGNSGFVWECETPPLFDHNHGAACTTVIMSGIIAWMDGQNRRIMGYDPRTGGVFCLSAGTDIGLTTVTGTVTSGAILTANTAAYSGLWEGPIGYRVNAGCVVKNTSTGGAERAMVTEAKDASVHANTIRGWDGTTALTATFATTGHTISSEHITPFPITHMTFDFTNNTLLWDNNTFPTSSYTLHMNVMGGYQPLLRLRMDDIGSLGQPYVNNRGAYPVSWLQTSLYDFDSSLQKYFRTVQIDYDTLQLTGRTDEAAGSIFAWYKLNSVMGRTHDPWTLPQDLTPLNQLATTTIVSGTNSATDTSSIQVASVANIAVGYLVYGNGGTTAQSAIVTAISGSTITIGRRGYLGGGFDKPGSTNGLAGDTSPTPWATGGTITIQAPITSGTRYAVNATGQSIQMHLEMVAGAVSSTTTPYSLGPILKKMIVRGVPIQPGYRQREYQIAMFNDQPRISSGKAAGVPNETRTPAELRAALEALLAANSPISVSDGSMTSTLCAFLSDQCKFREIRPNEYVAYIAVREV